MIRRTNRLRREFIYRKSLEGKERELYEKKRKIRECLEEGKAIPTELRNSEAELRKELALEAVETATNGAAADDEYKNANLGTPRCSSPPRAIPAGSRSSRGGQAAHAHRSDGSTAARRCSPTW